jgi:hypothetical protein
MLTAGTPMPGYPKPSTHVTVNYETIAEAPGNENKVINRPHCLSQLTLYILEYTIVG